MKAFTSPSRTLNDYRDYLSLRGEKCNALLGHPFSVCSVWKSLTSMAKFSTLSRSAFNIATILSGRPRKAVEFSYTVHFVSFTPREVSHPLQSISFSAQSSENRQKLCWWTWREDFSERALLNDAKPSWVHRPVLMLGEGQSASLPAAHPSALRLFDTHHASGEKKMWTNKKPRRINVTS